MDLETLMQSDQYFLSAIRSEVQRANRIKAIKPAESQAIHNLSSAIRNRKMPARAMRGYRRINSLITVIEARYHEHGELPTANVLESAYWIIADCLFQAMGQNLDITTFADTIKARATTNILFEDEDLAIKKIREVCDTAERRRGFFKMTTDEKAGHSIELTPEEREQHGVTTMYAIGQTKDEMHARRKAIKREVSRSCMKKKRIKDGATPREDAAARTKPWEAFGISRKTWYKRGKPDPATLKTNIVQLEDFR